MKVCKGSFTIEATYIIPLVMFCICIAIEAGISMREEIKEQVSVQAQSAPLDIIACMYRREFVKELFGELYED